MIGTEILLAIIGNWEEGMTTKGTKKFWAAVKVFYILIMVVITWLYVLVKLI